VGAGGGHTDRRLTPIGSTSVQRLATSSIDRGVSTCLFFADMPDTHPVVGRIAGVSTVAMADLLAG
jgi:hypothetical protein